MTHNTQNPLKNTFKTNHFFYITYFLKLIFLGFLAQTVLSHYCNPNKRQSFKSLTIWFPFPETQYSYIITQPKAMITVTNMVNLNCFFKNCTHNNENWFLKLYKIITYGTYNEKRKHILWKRIQG